MIAVVMGVSGSGKSTVGRLLAGRLGWTFIEGDDLHPQANRRKMSAGKPLTDTDRWPWLDRIVAEVNGVSAHGGSAIIACSALRRSYRDRLRTCDGPVHFLHLEGDPAIIRARMNRRTGHFMPPALLESQLATLELASGDEILFSLDIGASPNCLVEQAVQWLLREG